MTDIKQAAETLRNFVENMNRVDRPKIGETDYGFHVVPDAMLALLREAYKFADAVLQRESSSPFGRSAAKFLDYCDDIIEAAEKGAAS